VAVEAESSSAPYAAISYVNHSLRMVLNAGLRIRIRIRPDPKLLSDLDPEMYCNGLESRIRIMVPDRF